MLLSGKEEEEGVREKIEKALSHFLRCQFFFSLSKESFLQRKV